ncbi:TonB-dependent receptor [bacterium SCSIO 12741]|nr:TonB-dependent receptor [bacterium SCSIO 12741]
MKRILWFILVVMAISPLAHAQSGLKISGRVLESESKQPIQYATVLMIDTATQKNITGITTQEDGTFELFAEPRKDFVIEVSFIGYLKYRITEFTPQNGVIQLGDVLLSPDHKALNELVVEGEKSQTIFKLDKRVFNVGADLSTTGASALEVLNNVPSVTVNIEGQVSLRGSEGVQILINGKPSVMTDEGSNLLGTITADMIERVEVITNPSAKYEAEGTSGIINIVLKKEEKKGFNGSVTLNAGMPLNNSIGISLNKRTEKFNLFTQMGAGRRTFPREQTTENRDLVNETTVSSLGKAHKNETFYNLIVGADYHLNENNTFSLSGKYAYEIEDEDAEYDFQSYNMGVQDQAWTRNENTHATNPKWDYEFQYAHDFKSHKEHDLVFSASGFFFGKQKSSEFADHTTFGDRTPSDQHSATEFENANYIFKLDYTYPFAERFKWELGSQYRLDNTVNDYQIGSYQGGELILNPNLTNLFRFQQNVLGVYSTMSYEYKKWGAKVGLRLENTDLSTTLETTNQNNTRNYTNLFPSVHTSYKLTEHWSFQAGYSKRIFRPRAWDLNPFTNIRNNFNVTTGNPNLQPEFTDSYELTSILATKKASFNFGVYYRYTQDVIERVTAFENNVSATLPVNIGTNSITGLEFNAKYSPFKKMDLRADINWNAFDRKGEYQGTSLDYNGIRWTTRLTTKFKLPYKFDLELTGNYQSPYNTIQGERKDNLFADLGLRKKMMKGKLVAHLSIRDLFASRVFETVTEEPGFYVYNKRQSGRFITLGVSYSLGKGEAMEFSGQKRF